MRQLIIGHELMVAKKPFFYQIQRLTNQYIELIYK